MPHAMTRGMSHRNVEMLIGRLATDAELRRRFEHGPGALLRELIDAGCELTTIEREALATIDSEAIRTFAGTLDSRLRKLDPDTRPELHHE